MANADEQTHATRIGDQLSGAGRHDAANAEGRGVFGDAKAIRQRFDDQGVSIADWAHQHGFSVDLTRAILSGKRRCIRGQSHQIAVALGLKRPIGDSEQDSLFSYTTTRKEDPMTT
jgi:gp16 family phage-associated protein